MSVNAIPNISFQDLPEELLALVISNTDSNTLIRTSSLFKKWLELSLKEEVWQKRSLQELPFLQKEAGQQWREHYVLNCMGSCIRKIEKATNNMFVGALGNYIIKFSKIQHDQSKIGYETKMTYHEHAITSFACKPVIYNNRFFR